MLLCTTRWLLALAFFAAPPVVRAQDPDSTATADSLLVEELAREMAGFGEEASLPAQQAAPRTRPSTNPDISVIGDIQAFYHADEERNIDVVVNEIETSLRSVVDPFARADIYLSIGRHEEEEGGEGHEGEEEAGGLEFELEEAYLTTLSLPFRLQLKAGKFRSNIGKINRIHPHALPFIDVPAVYANFLGDEGLNDEGVSLSWLLPNPSFFQELTVEVTRGPGENESFVFNEGNRLLYTSHLKNFWDLSANSTLELGFSGVAGPNDVGLTTLLGGVDLTYIWKPVQFNTFQSFTLQAEAFVSGRKVSDAERLTAWGMYAMARYQLARRWFLIGRFDHSDLPDDTSWNENAFSGTLGWYATEFQKLELGVKTSSGDQFDRTYQGMVRLVFVIGTHGAHEY